MIKTHEFDEVTAVNNNGEINESDLATPTETVNKIPENTPQNVKRIKHQLDNLIQELIREDKH